MKKWLVSIVLVGLLLAVCSATFATDIFVATNGNDENPGTISQPLKTLHKAVEIASAGDNIYLRAGSYNQFLYWDFGANGSAGNYITIQAYDGDLTATMYNTEETLSLYGRTYIKVIGMEFKTGSNILHIHGNAHHIYVQRCWVHNAGQEGDCVKGNQSDYVYVEDCEVATPGVRGGGGYQECIDYVDVDYAEMKRNYCHDFGNMAWYSKGGSENTVIDSNIASTQISPDWDPAVGFGGQTDTEYMDGATYQSYNMVMRNNIIRNVPGGAVGTYDCYHGYFYNNLIHNAGGMNGSTENEVIQQRTSCMCLSPPSGPQYGDGQTTGVYFFNNVFLDTRGTMPTVYGYRSGYYSDFQTGYNNYYNNGNAIPSGGMVNPNNETGATFGNPNLANPTGTATTWAGWKNCYRITASSSLLIDHGTSNAGNTPYPAVSTDMDGASRPQGSGYDIGPFEYAGAPVPPVANFTGNPTSGYTPLAVSFTDTSSGSPTAWSWNFGDSNSSTAQNPSHTYTTAGSFTVSLRATNAQGYDDEVKTNYITASTLPSAPVAAFSGTPTTGTIPLAVTFTDASTNSPTAWSWNFGDTNTSTVQNPSHTYVNAGSYTVSLRATNAGGYDDEVKTNYITANVGSATPTFVAAGAVASNAAAITPALPAGIAVNDILLLCLETANQAITIPTPNGGTWTEVTNSPQGTGTAGGTAATRLTVFWSRYNGTQGAPTTSDSGNHQLGRILAVRGCVASGNPWDVTAGGVESTVDTSGAIPGATTTLTNTLVVAAIATALPDASGTANFSAWTNANLTSVTERTDNTVTAGNGGGLGLATGEKASAGAYGNTTVTCGTATAKGMLSIALKSGGGGGGSAPVAAFSGTPTSGAAPLSVSFTDASTNSPTAWSWNFGDGNTSTAQNPSHSYAAGTFTVSLRATNAYGYDDEVKTNYISATGGGGTVYVYPYTVSSYHNCATIAGSLSDTQTSNDVYHQVRCDTSSHQYSQLYFWDTDYTPSQVNKIKLEWEWHGSRSDTPLYSVLFVKATSGYTQILDSMASPTSDYTFSWETTAVSTYMKSDGTMEVRMCGCNQNSNHYDTYNDLVRITLTLN